MYYNGKGVKKSYSNARKWYLKSASQKDTNSQYMLGVIYENGFGVKRNYSNAIKWFKMAAKQGDGEALNKLGLMVMDGRGVKVSKTLGCALFITARETSSSHYAHSNANDCYDKLNTEQIKTSEKLSQEMREPDKLFKAFDLHIKNQSKK